MESYLRQVPDWKQDLLLSWAREQLTCNTVLFLLEDRRRTEC